MEHENLDAALTADTAGAENAVEHGDDQELKDRRFMAAALRLACQIERRPWPNPPVGAVVVKDGQVVGRGAHEGAGTPHAEVHALAAAGPAARGATLYCTLEPCNHTGRTPPCTEAILQHGIARVVAGIRDPNPEVTGEGLRHLAKRGVRTSVGVLGQEACDLVWPFLVTRAFSRPFVLLKTAVTLDGRFTPGPPPPGQVGPRYLTGEEARRDVHCQRRWMDLILVGEGTLRSDRPRLDGRLATGSAACPAQDPLPGYVDSDLSWSGGWEQERYLLFTARSPGRPEVVAKLTAAGAWIIPCGTRAGRVDPRSLVDEAHRRGVHTMMVEGGPTLANAFLATGVVDRWVHYIAPRFTGAGLQWSADCASQQAVDFHLTSCRTLGGDVRLVYDRDSFTKMAARLTRSQAGNGVEEGSGGCSPA